MLITASECFSRGHDPAPANGFCGFSNKSVAAERVCRTFRPAKMIGKNQGIFNLGMANFAFWRVGFQVDVWPRELRWSMSGWNSVTKQSLERKRGGSRTAIKGWAVAQGVLLSPTHRSSPHIRVPMMVYCTICSLLGFFDIQVQIDLELGTESWRHHSYHGGWEARLPLLGGSGNSIRSWTLLAFASRHIVSAQWQSISKASPYLCTQYANRILLRIERWHVLCRRWLQHESFSSFPTCLRRGMKWCGTVCIVQYMYLTVSEVICTATR